VHGLETTSVHAEHKALLEFKKLVELKRNRSRGNNRKEIPVVDIYSWRCSKTLVLGNARPCLNCLMRMKKAEDKLEIVIRFVYYSTSNGFKKERFDQMLSSPLTHVSSGTRHINNIRKKKKRGS